MQDKDKSSKTHKDQESEKFYNLQTKEKKRHKMHGANT